MEDLSHYLEGPFDVSRLESLKKLFLSRPQLAVILLICVNLVIGIAVVGDYSESWDEANNKIYAEQSLGAYSWLWDKSVDLERHLGPTNQRYRGPAYPVLATLLVSLLQRVNQEWAAIDLWHFSSFLAFQLGLLFFYSLCRRVIGNWAAFGATVLFSSQPLLWGHAFVNSKDIPFMVFTLGSIALGFKMVAVSLTRPASTVVPEASSLDPHVPLAESVSQDWKSASKVSKKAFVGLTGLLVILLFIARTIEEIVTFIVIQVYRAGPSSFLRLVVSQFAQNLEALQPEQYVHKSVVLYRRIEPVLFTLLLVFFLILAYYLFRSTAQRLHRALDKSWRSLRRPLFLFAAGLFLGLAVSTRVLGALAGAIVFGYALRKAGRHAIPVLLTYALIAVAVTYITWPFLWPDPLGNFIRSLQASSNFEWTGDVLFQGRLYKSYDLPWTYLPVLMALQFTEPILVLTLTGIFLAGRRSLKKSMDWIDALWLGAWFIVPLILVMVFRPIMYDNFRHSLFILPPVFIFAGIALEAVFRRVPSKVLSALIFLGLVIPGILGGISLHPYQYIYYNGLAGGVRGAFREYELDYWVTSYREATFYLNREAPLNSKVLVIGPRRIFIRYAREDLNSKWFTANEIPSFTDPVYVLLYTRRNQDLTLFPEAKTVYTVTRDGADLATVKRIQ